MFFKATLRKNSFSLLEKGLSCLSVVFAASLFSCTNPSQIASLEDITLRKTASSIENTLEWTLTIEPEVLTEDLKQADGIEKSVKVDGRVVVATDASSFKTQKIYPAVKGFAPLDTSALSEGARETLNNFCSSLVNGEDAARYMAPDSAYSLALFLYDLEESGIQENQKSPFSRYLLGEPFMGEIVQCPVRFFYSSPEKNKDSSVPKLMEDSLDVFVYLLFTDDSWRVCQIAYIGEGK